MKKIIYIAAALLAFASCRDWFDAAPKTDYSDEKTIFSSEDSYRNFLNKIYDSLRGRELYGYNMNQGGVEFMGQTMVQSGEFAPWISHDYQSALLRSAAGEIYETMYDNIYSCNRILHLLRTRGGDVVFVKGAREMMTGEAVALRAFLHFDLLRLFNPSVKVDPAFMGIVWMDGTDGPALRLSTRGMLEKIVAELDVAVGYLKDTDPIKTGVGLNAGTLFGAQIADRYWKMNYYAALAVKARAHMCLEQYGDASECAVAVYSALNAKDVKDGKKPEDCALQFPMIQTFSNDRAFSQEHVFAFASNQAAGGAYSFPAVSDYVAGLGTTLAEHIAARVQGLPADDKRLNWFSNDRAGVNRKYGGTPANVVDMWSLPQRMPAVRVGEMYLLDAEARVRNGVPDKGLEVLDGYARLRMTNTQLASMPGADEIIAEIVRQAEIELICEGQIFFLHKRLNSAAIGGTAMSAGKYTLPIPQY